MATKSILLSIQPQWVAKILNGEKTFEIRKKFPAGYRGWVYIYCTKDIGKHGEKQLLNFFKEDEYFIGRDIDNYDPNDICYLGQNGKVVGRFWCDKVDYIEFSETDYQWGGIILESPNEELTNCDNFEKQSCLDFDDAAYYIGLNKVGYAVHITNVQVFPEPKELKEFKTYTKCKGCSLEHCCNIQQVCSEIKLTTAPQNYCYIEEAILL